MFRKKIIVKYFDIIIVALKLFVRYIITRKYLASQLHMCL